MFTLGLLYNLTLVFLSLSECFLADHFILIATLFTECLGASPSYG